MHEKKVLWVLVLLAAIVSSCDRPAEYDIRGTWRYTQYHLDGLPYDNGTITFDGAPRSGDWTLNNFYDVSYTGTYLVSGTQVVLDGDEHWNGNFMDAQHMEGTWQGAEESGTWDAVILQAARVGKCPAMPAAFPADTGAG